MSKDKLSAGYIKTYHRILNDDFTWYLSKNKITLGFEDKRQSEIFINIHSVTINNVRYIVKEKEFYKLFEIRKKRMKNYF
jgi:hypothetical protein